MFKKSKRLLAGLLAVLMAASAGQTVAFAAEADSAATQQAVVLAEPQLQNGTAVIPSNADSAAVKEALCNALVANADEVDACTFYLIRV